MLNFIYYNSPIGRLQIQDNGIAITSIVLASMNYPTPDEAHENSTALTQLAKLQLEEYFAGTRREFSLPLAPAGTSFQCRVWSALQNIPYGETRSYKQISEAIECPKGFRAVGMANNRNRIIIAIPCHRVVGASGKLVGYAGGLEVKEELLRLEGSL